MNQFCSVTMIARTTPGSHNPRNSAQTVTNRLREIVEKKTHTQCMFYMRRFFIGLVYIPGFVINPQLDSLRKTPFQSQQIEEFGVSIYTQENN